MSLAITACKNQGVISLPALFCFRERATQQWRQMHGERCFARLSDLREVIR